MSSAWSPASTTPSAPPVYERLGIPTVATVPWTTDRLLNVLTRETETTKWRDPSGNVGVTELALHEDWVGRRVTDLEAATGGRVAFMIRFGSGLLPDPKTVIQAGDQVYVAAVSGHIAEALAIAALPPERGQRGRAMKTACDDTEERRR